MECIHYRYIYWDMWSGNQNLDYNFFDIFLCLLIIIYVRLLRWYIRRCLYTLFGFSHREGRWCLDSHPHPPFYTGQFNFFTWEVSEVSNFKTFLNPKIISENVPIQTLLPVFRYKPSQVIVALFC